ncbi:wd40 repeat-like protein [Histomonas meleagridis]|uniref:wd40 repeat-like protein n=1 Tax=Histomonas meleagridis TaxID=135588 RepID=UPI0035599F3A|nr:wd40 repeat-like protein [Histomonas meleagridis]KAH0801810.1 wd40 repeat-like protein [Histomonas meleagridis]
MKLLWRVRFSVPSSPVMINVNHSKKEKMLGGMDSSLQIKNLDTGEIISIEEYVSSEASKKYSVSMGDNQQTKIIKPRHFLKNKKNAFFNNAVISQSIKCHNGSVRCIKSSPNGKYFASGDECGVVVLFSWDPTTKKVKQLSNFEEHKSDITCLDFSKDDDLLISSSLDCSVKLWHSTQTKSLSTFKHEDSVTAVSFHPSDPSIFFACTFPNYVLVWNIKQSEIIKTIDFTSAPTAGTFSPDGHSIVIGCFNGFCYIYSYPEFQYVTQFVAGPRKKVHKPSEKVTSLVYINDNRLFVSTNDSRIRLYSMDNFSLIRKYIGHVAEVGQAQMSCSSDQNLVMIPSEKKGAIYIYPIDHERYFKAKFMKNSFSRERSQTSEGFKLKDTNVTSAAFIGNSSISSLSIVCGDTGGNVYVLCN